MNEPRLGIWLRSERERRGITLKNVADQTKVAAPLLEGLEAGDLSRWPGGIYRKAFVKAYARALGLDPDEIVRRFEQEHPPEPSDVQAVPAPDVAVAPGEAGPRTPAAEESQAAGYPSRTRILATAADLTVALVLGLGSAAAGSRLLWPVLLIAIYYAIGVLLTGTSPMMALLVADAAPTPPAPEPSRADAHAPANPRPQAERGHVPRRTAANRPQRVVRNSRQRVQ